MLRTSLPALVLGVASSQADDVELRVLPWYAARVLQESLVGHVVFTLGADTSARQRGSVARAFERAGLPLVPALDARHGDTLQVFFTNVVTESVTSAGTFLFFGRTTLKCVGGRVRTEQRVVHVRCDARACAHRYDQFIEGEAFNPPPCA